MNRTSRSHGTRSRARGSATKPRGGATKARSGATHGRGAGTKARTGGSSKSRTTRATAAGERRRAPAPRARASRADATQGKRPTSRELARLSPSTQRAKWVTAPNEEADRPGQTLATRSPDVIRSWADARRAEPATSPNGDPERPRVLRFDFPGYDKSLQPVEWDAWLRVFRERGLVFLFQQRLKSGRQSNFFRLDAPDREDG